MTPDQSCKGVKKFIGSSDFIIPKLDNNLGNLIIPVTKTNKKEITNPISTKYLTLFPTIYYNIVFNIIKRFGKNAEAGI